MGFVYIIYDSKEHYKIGRSESIEERIKQIQTSNANKIIFINSFECKDSVILENKLHKYFEKNRINGEWFKFTEQELKNCVKYAEKLINEIHAKLDKNTCKTCNFSTYRNENFAKHVNSESHRNATGLLNYKSNCIKVNMYKCNVCEKLFNSKIEFKEHIFLEHNPTNALFDQELSLHRCSYCDKAYSSQLNLNKHIKISCKNFAENEKKEKVTYLLNTFSNLKQEQKSTINKIKEKILSIGLIDKIKPEDIEKTKLKNPQNQCVRCEKLFMQKIDYMRHINRKKPCNNANINVSALDINNAMSMDKHIDQQTIININANIDEIKCNFCDKIYSTKFNLNKHVKKCKKVIKCNEEKNQIADTILSEISKIKESMKLTLNEITEKKIILENKIKEYDGQKNEEIKKDKTVSFDEEIKKDKTVSFGKENLEFIEDNKLLDLFKTEPKLVNKLVEIIHFNEDKSEYKNIYISNIKNKFINVQSDNEWILGDRQEFISKLIVKYYDFIESKYNELDKKGTIDDATRSKVDRFLDERDTEPSLSKLNNDIQLLLYNKRKMILNKKEVKRIEEN
jgi:uncharacterized C2H2 Zn-finger protein